MPSVAYVYETKGYADQTARGDALKAAVEAWWPGSTVKLAPHPMGGLRAQITLIDEDAANDFRGGVYLCLIAQGFWLVADQYGRHDL